MGCVEIYKDKWAALLAEGNWDVKDLKDVKDVKEWPN